LSCPETGQGNWRLLIVQQVTWEKAVKDGGAKTVGELEERLKGNG
jgi:hypothetical protein